MEQSKLLQIFNTKKKWREIFNFNVSVNFITGPLYSGGYDTCKRIVQLGHCDVCLVL